MLVSGDDDCREMKTPYGHLSVHQTFNQDKNTRTNEFRSKPSLADSEFLHADKPLPTCPYSDQQTMHR